MKKRCGLYGVDGSGGFRLGGPRPDGPRYDGPHSGGPRPGGPRPGGQSPRLERLKYLRAQRKHNRVFTV